METYLKSNSDENESLDQSELMEITSAAEGMTQHFASTTDVLKAELERVSTAIDTWERLAPKLYFMKKRLIVIHDILSGKRDIESIVAPPQAEEKSDKKKRGPKKGSNKVFIRRKSDILTDAVIEKIKEFIARDEDYHKSKEIYAYLIDNNLIPPYDGKTPDRMFAISLARVDQDLIKYNNHFSIMAWGLPDFGTPEHARRKALKNSAKGREGTRVSSYGREKHEMSDVAVGV
ncbi:MAG: hypothetical protein WCH46_07780 [bacterium]